MCSTRRFLDKRDGVDMTRKRKANVENRPRMKITSATGTVSRVLGTRERRGIATKSGLVPAHDGLLTKIRWSTHIECRHPFGGLRFGGNRLTDRCYSGSKIIISRGDVQDVERELLWFECDSKSDGFAECACFAWQCKRVVVRVAFFTGNASNLCQRGW